MAKNDDETKDDKTIPETIRKLLMAGVGAAFMTEEGIRSYLSDLKLPKDVIGLILKNANRSKEDMMARIASEISKVLNRIDFVVEASRFVEEHKFKITAEIEVLKKESPSGENVVKANITMS